MRGTFGQRPGPVALDARSRAASLASWRQRAGETLTDEDGGAGGTALPSAAAKAFARAYDEARIAAGAVRLAGVSFGCCHFPVSADDCGPGDHLFCAAPVALRDPASARLEARYCAHHAARARARHRAKG